MRITVIGAANIDITTKSKSKIVPGDINPADISLTAGGVARNISVMLASRGETVDFITAVGKDPFGALLRKSCTGAGVNTDAWIVKTNVATGVCLETLNSNGNRHAAFSTISAPESMRSAEITKHKALIKEADLLILDLNLTEKIIGLILELRDNRPIMVDAVSVDKVMRIESFFDKVDILRLNRLEAERLTGIVLETKERVKQACYYIVSKGVHRVFTTLGMAGVCAADKNNAIFVPAVPMAVKDATGAGDAFSAGIAMTFSEDLRSQAESGVKTAAEHLGRNA